MEKYLELFKAVTADTAGGVAYLKEKLAGFLDPEYADGLITIMNSVEAGEIRGFPHRLRSHPGPWHVLLHRPHF